MRMSRRVASALTAITIVGAVARFWGLSFGLPYTTARPDENFIIDVARSFLRGDFSPRFYDYPWLYMWVMSGVYLAYYLWGVLAGTFHSVADLLASWPVHWEPFYLLSRGLSATCGTLTLLVVFWIGRRLWDEVTGLLAAFFLSLAFLHVRDSHFGTTDIAMTFLATIAVGYIVDGHLARRGSFVRAGLVGGLAAATKYNAVLLPLAMLTSQALHVMESPGRRLRAAFDRRLPMFGIAFVLAFAVGIPFVILDTERFLASMALLKTTLAVGGPGARPTTIGWLHHLQVSLRYGLGLPLLLTGLAGIVGVIARTPTIGLLLFSYPIAYFAMAGSLRELFFRYAIPVVPFLCLAAAWLVRLAGRHLASQTLTGIVPLAWRREVLVTTALSLAVILPSAVSTWQFDRVINQTDNRVLVSRWFQEHVPAGSSVLQSGSRYGLAQFDPQLHYREWIWDGGRQAFFVDRQAAEGRPDWIVVQESPLPSRTQEIVTDFLLGGYHLNRCFVAVSLEQDFHLYDRQDAFFVPYAGFTNVQRPGPNFCVFERGSAGVVR
jgi:hypothetical protein